MSIQSSAPASASTSGYTGASAGGSLIAGVASIANSIVTPIAQRRAQRRAMEYNKSMMDYQNEINLRNWRLENAYNTPQAQMLRYTQAGLNPNLIAMDGSSGLASDVGSVTPSSFSGSDFDSGVSGALSNLGETGRNLMNDYFTNKIKSYQADRHSMENQRVGSTLIQTINDDLANLFVRGQMFMNQSISNNTDYWRNVAEQEAYGVNGSFGSSFGDTYLQDRSFSDKEQFNKLVETTKLNITNNLRSAVYDSMLHDLDGTDIDTKRGYLKMLQDKYKVEENIAEFEKGLQDMSWKEMTKKPGIIVSRCLSLLLKANSIIQPYYMEHRRSIELNRPRTTQVLDPFGVVQSTRYTY